MMLVKGVGGILKGRPLYNISRDKRGDIRHTVGGGSKNIKTLVSNTIMTYYISLESS